MSFQKGKVYGTAGSHAQRIEMWPHGRDCPTLSGRISFQVPLDLPAVDYSRADLSFAISALLHASTGMRQTLLRRKGQVSTQERGVLD